MPKGTTSLFREEFPDLARKLCLLGAIDRDLARIFEVSVRTINNWKRQHPDFAAALKSGKAEADGAVAEALYRKAVKGEMRLSASGCATGAPTSGATGASRRDVRIKHDAAQVRRFPDCRTMPNANWRRRSWRS